MTKTSLFENYQIGNPGRCRVRRDPTRCRGKKKIGLARLNSEKSLKRVKPRYDFVT